jgi:hypothetical protein
MDKEAAPEGNFVLVYCSDLPVACLRTIDVHLILLGVSSRSHLFRDEVKPGSTKGAVVVRALLGV